MGKSLTYEEVKNRVESVKGFRLLDDDYINNTIKLNIECPEGHRFPILLNNFIKQGRCPICFQLNRPDFIDITGQQFGEWEVKEYVGNRLFKCICSCGTERNVSSWDLRSNKTKSCGHPEDLTGRVFGDWIVLGLDKVINKKQPYWICQCKCETISSIAGNALKNGKSLSCIKCYGKKISEYRLNDLTGKTFGKLTVIKRVENDKTGKPMWWCKCDCDEEKAISSTALLQHGQQTCGCSHNLKGENHSSWQGGQTEIKAYLRNNLNQWKLDSLNICNYKCIITGLNQKEMQIHHLVPFSKIFKEIWEISNLPRYQTIGEYTNKELLLIIDLFTKLHYKYGLGVFLINKLHIEFHKIYGKINFTPENFYEFYENKTGRIFDPSFLMVNDQNNNIKITELKEKEVI